jgi:hypothetical protein
MNERPAVLFNSAEEDPPADLIIASADWPAAARLGAVLVSAEYRSNHGLWVLPGALLNTLRGREYRRRWEAEDLLSQVTVRQVAASRVADSAASGGLARRGWPGVVPRGGSSLVLVYGPYATLVPGRHEVTFRLARGPDGEAPAVELDVVAGYGTRILASAQSAELGGGGDLVVTDRGYGTVKFSVETEEPIPNVEFRVFYHARGGEVRVDYIELVSRLTASAGTALGRDSGRNAAG